MHDSIIQIRDLRTCLDNKVVHRNLNLSIQRSEVYVVLGESGSGKSVLLKTMFGFIKPTKGRISIDGYDVLRESERRKAIKHIAFLFQSGGVFDSLSVAENIAFVPYYFESMSKREIDRLVDRNLDLVGLPAYCKHKRPDELSLGERKQVALARSLGIEPKINFYDEPTTGLDLKARQKINCLILKLKHELHVTSVVVTHDISSAYTIADRIALLRNGVIVACGTVEEIRFSTDPYVHQFVHKRV